MQIHIDLLLLCIYGLLLLCILIWAYRSFFRTFPREESHYSARGPGEVDSVYVGYVFIDDPESGGRQGAH